MFSLRFQDRPRTVEADHGMGRRLLGRFLGFAAGLTIAYAFDAYLLDGSVRNAFLRNDWSMVARGVRGVVGWIAAR